MGAVRAGIWGLWKEIKGETEGVMRVFSMNILVRVMRGDWLE